MSKCFFKTALTICVLSFFPISCAIAMEDENQYNHIRARNIEQQEETCCSLKRMEKCHWGLYHWVAGIKEFFFDRCLMMSFCCQWDSYDDKNPDRVYLTSDEDQKGIYTVRHSSDCYCCSCDVTREWCDNAATITFGCPVVALTHILCLPRYCMDASPNPTVTIYLTFAQQEKFRLERNSQRENYENMTVDEKKFHDRLCDLQSQTAQVAFYNSIAMQNRSNLILARSQAQSHAYWARSHPGLR